MSNKKVRFFFDYQSPYSYFAANLIEEICDRHGAEVHWEPMVLGGIFQKDETTPLFRRPKRAEYLDQDMENTATYLGLNYKKRTEFLFNSINAMRATLQIPQGKERGKAVKALFRAVFEDDQNLGDMPTLQKYLDAAGFDGATLVAGTQDQAVKDQLKANTDEADSLGVFGAPTAIMDDGKMFWGHDRMNMLDYFLEKTKE